MGASRSGTSSSFYQAMLLRVVKLKRELSTWNFQLDSSLPGAGDSVHGMGAGGSVWVGTGGGAGRAVAGDRQGVSINLRGLLESAGETLK